MQAGEKLTFVIPAAELPDFSHLPAQTHEHFIEMFRDILSGIISRYLASKRTEPIVGEKAMIYLHEIPLMISAEDESFLHILITWRSLDAGGERGLNLELRLTEHGEDGAVLKSHAYQQEDGQVVRRDMDHSYDERPVRQKFSMIHAIKSMIEIEEMEASEWDAERSRAQAIRERLDDAAQNLELEKIMGLNTRPIAGGELKLLKNLLKEAVPYEDE